MVTLHLVDEHAEPEPCPAPEPADTKQDARDAITEACRNEALNPLERIEHLLAIVTREVDFLKHALSDATD